MYDWIEARCKKLEMDAIEWNEERDRMKVEHESEIAYLKMNYDCHLKTRLE